MRLHIHMRVYIHIYMQTRKPVYPFYALFQVGVVLYSVFAMHATGTVFAHTAEWLRGMMEVGMTDG